MASQPRQEEELRATAAEVAEIFPKGFDVLTNVPALSWSKRTPGVVARVGGLPFSLFNGLFIHGGEADPDVVAELIDAVDASGMPSSVRMRPDIPQAVHDVLTAKGFTICETLPLMAVDRDQFHPAAQSDVPIRLLGPEEDCGQAALIAEGLHSPVDAIEAFMSTSNRRSPAWRTYVGELDGTLAVTGTAIRCEDHLSLACIVANPEYRRRGHAAHLTSTMVSDGFASGARRAFLHASDMSFRMYQTLGFRFLEYWSVWMRADG